MAETPLSASVDFYDLGVQHFLIGLHTPDRMGTSYPTRDRHTPEQEARFIDGWETTRRQYVNRFMDEAERENFHHG